MALAAGTRLGPYEVVAKIGEGGMGEVYRATDTNLARQVAIKVLPEAVAADPDRLARFDREAKTLAALNHPNIAAIYGLERTDGQTALIMELVEGPTLADRIAQGPIPVDEALPIAKQIAEALEAAHEQGIIHRDLKPANIKVRPDGTVKVLDFGLAKAMEPNVVGRDVSPAGRSHALTITSPVMMTGAGMILGTAAYMSPEQAKGRPADKRSDVWAFGCVLYEMLTGHRVFEAEDVAETFAAVLTKSPDWSTRSSRISPLVLALLRGCLERDRRQRVSDMSTPLFVLKEPGALVAGDLTTPSGGARRWLVAPLVSGAAVTALTLGMFLWARLQTGGSDPNVQLEVALGTDASLFINGPVGSGPSAIISPDGRTLVFVARSGEGPAQVFTRRLDQLQGQPIAGTDGASNPFFSPDGRAVAFFAEGKLKKVSVSGGPVVSLADAASPRGGAWADDGTIVFQPSGNRSSLHRVSSSGGTPDSLMPLADGEATQRWPQMLPGSKAVLFTSNASTGAGYADADVVVQALPAGPRRVLQRRAYYGRYLPSGHLLFVRDNTLFAARFDAARLELAGQPFPVIEGVVNASGNGGAQVSVSDTGTLVYLPGTDDNEGAAASISWLDRSGRLTPLQAKPLDWSNPQFSPDGSRLAVDLIVDSTNDVWVYDWARDALTKLTLDAASDRLPIWSPDGRRIVFRSTRGNQTGYNLYWQSSDGSGETQRLTESAHDQLPASWHPNGKLLAFHELVSDSNRDVMLLRVEGSETTGWKPGTPSVFLNGRFNEELPMFSPDGRWMAYVSDESGRREVYVRSFAGLGGKWQVSTDGGNHPAWSVARGELFYESPDDRIMFVTYDPAGDSFRPGKAAVWSETPFLRRPRQRSIALHPDGNRFAMATRPAEGTVRIDKVVFVFGFFEQLKRLAPASN